MSPLVRKGSMVGILVWFLLTTVSAYNITKMLEKEPEFSNFNQLLTQTGLAKEINGRKTITVLAIPNDAMGALNGKPLDVVKSILETHVILDYYDTSKLENMKGKSSELTTLFQSTGVAHNQQGFLNATDTKDGVYFGSAVKNASHDVKLMGSVASVPYNISVLSVSQPIDTPGLDENALRPVAAPPPETVAAPSPAEEESPAESPEVESPPPRKAPTPSPSPADDDKSPALSPSEPDADTADDAASPPNSSAGKLLVSTLGLAAALASCLAAF